MSVETEEYMHSEAESLIYDNDGELRNLSKVAQELDGEIDPNLYGDLEQAYGEGRLERSSIEMQDHFNVEDGDGCVEVWEHLSEGRN